MAEDDYPGGLGGEEGRLARRGACSTAPRHARRPRPPRAPARDCATQIATAGGVWGGGKRRRVLPRHAGARCGAPPPPTLPPLPPPPDEVEERLVNEEYKIWKKNTPFLYGGRDEGGGAGRPPASPSPPDAAHPLPTDLVITHALEWPSLTAQWLPVRGGGGGAGRAPRRRAAAQPVRPPPLPGQNGHRDRVRAEAGAGHAHERGGAELPDAGRGGRRGREARGGGARADAAAVPGRPRAPHHPHPTGPPPPGRRGDRRPRLRRGPGRGRRLWRGGRPRPGRAADQPRGGGQPGAGHAAKPVHDRDQDGGRRGGGGEVERDEAPLPPLPPLDAPRSWLQVSAEVYVFDYTKHPSKPEPGGRCNPDLRLAGHRTEGYGLAWSPHTEGRLLSGSDDAQICLWDVAGAPRGARTLDAASTFREHLGVVEDVAWHGTLPHVFGSVGDDRQLILWDARAARSSAATEAHGAEVNCLHFNPFNEFVLATGSADKTVRGRGRGVRAGWSGAARAPRPPAPAPPATRSPCTTSATWPSPCTSCSTTPRKCSRCSGARTPRPSSRRAAPTGASCCGTSPASATSRRPTTRPTGRRSCCSSTAGTRPRSGGEGGGGGACRAASHSHPTPLSPRLPPPPGLRPLLVTQR